MKAFIIVVAVIALLGTITAQGAVKSVQHSNANGISRLQAAEDAANR